MQPRPAAPCSATNRVEARRSLRTRLSRLACAAAFALSAAAPPSASACVWHYDTIEVERSVEPSEKDLLNGKFIRRSPESYQWRIEDRKQKLAGNPSKLEWYDDLAVAYQKTGRHALAVETILKKEAIKPGLYETYSNLGTFFILEGDFERGLPYIDKALAINPSAQFGREKYQKFLVEYAMERRVDGKVLFPLGAPHDGSARDSFAKHLARKAGAAVLPAAEIAPAIQGVMGMMRFANHRNPLLLEALGDLHVEELAAKANQGEAPELAARAYLAASYEVPDTGAQEWYRKEAARVPAAGDGRPQSNGPDASAEERLARLEERFLQERRDADRWYSDVKAQEVSWIAAGADVDQEFRDRYLTVRGVRMMPSSSSYSLAPAAAMIIGGLAVVFFGGCFFALVGLLMRLDAPQPTPAKPVAEKFDPTQAS